MRKFKSIYPDIMYCIRLFTSDIALLVADTTSGFLTWFATVRHFRSTCAMNICKPKFCLEV